MELGKEEEKERNGIQFKIGRRRILDPAAKERVNPPFIADILWPFSVGRWLLNLCNFRPN